MQNGNLLELPEIRNIHFTGIGGISMSGLAEILVSQGYHVSGSDMKESGITHKLEKMGIRVMIGHFAENTEGADLVVHTAAVKENNPELVEARRKGIPVIDRATLLGQIMKIYPNSIAISGTHGKTTTTSMVSMMLLESSLDPTIHIGGELDAIGGTTRIGKGGYFIAEACEYTGSFLKFHPTMGVILNIEFDHADYFRDLEHVKDTFLQFTALIPEDGYLVACTDDANIRTLLGQVSCRIITYGLKSEDAMWSARNIAFDDYGCASYMLMMNSEEMGSMKLKVPGIHNVSNSLAAIAASYTMGCDIPSIRQALLKFTGTHRRFELKGTVDNIRVVDDYAHHPSEVQATLKAARNCGHPHVWCVFQPHTYTRTLSLMEEFSISFSDADTVIVADIYAAREADNGEVHAGMLVDRLREQGQNAVYISSFHGIVEFLESHVRPGDLIITMGAGDIYKVGEMYLENKKTLAVS